MECQVTIYKSCVWDLVQFTLEKLLYISLLKAPRADEVLRLQAHRFPETCPTDVPHINPPDPLPDPDPPPQTLKLPRVPMLSRYQVLTRPTLIKNENFLHSNQQHHHSLFAFRLGNEKDTQNLEKRPLRAAILISGRECG